MGKPEITNLSTINLVGGARTIIARIQHGQMQLEVTFYGNRNQKPGHVKVVVENDKDVPVPYPERYGREFNEDWVREYWRRNTGEDGGDNI